MKLDDKWRKSFESFLHFGTAKVQDLEGIEGKLVDDDTRRIWLTNTLSSQPDMDANICQTITTELTINGTNMSPSSVSIPWTNFIWYFLMQKNLTVPALSGLGAAKKLTRPIPIEIIPVVIPQPTITVPPLLLL
jgi:hypothetical protein